MAMLKDPNEASAIIFCTTAQLCRGISCINLRHGSLRTSTIVSGIASETLTCIGLYSYYKTLSRIEWFHGLNQPIIAAPSTFSFENEPSLLNRERFISLRSRVELTSLVLNRKQVLTRVFTIKVVCFPSTEAFETG